LARVSGRIGWIVGKGLKRRKDKGKRKKVKGKRLNKKANRLYTLSSSFDHSVFLNILDNNSEFLVKLTAMERWQSPAIR